MPLVDSIDPDAGANSTIFEEDSEGEHDDSKSTRTEKENEQSRQKESTKQVDPRQEAAFYGLRRTETIALIACFLGPLCGAYFLHALRTLLSPPSESLLNDFNLSVYVMVAEARPFALVCRLERSRISYLQTIAYPGGRPPAFSKEDIQELTRRIEAMEGNVAEALSSKDEKDINMEVSASVRQGLQPQLDALNRAVRRYEKRSVVQTMQTEARLNDLEMRVQDALSLAAAVARNGQKPSVVGRVLEWATGIVVYCARSVWAILTYPLHLIRQCGKIIGNWMPARPVGQVPKKGKSK
jgi:hypothetical protein